MKKLFFSILGFLSCVFTEAQTPIRLRSGISLSNLEADMKDKWHYDYRNRLYGGIATSIHLFDFFYLQPELNYMPQGAWQTGVQLIPEYICKEKGLPIKPTLYTGYNNSIKLDYVEASVLFKVEYGNRFKYFVAIGPYISILVGARQTVSGNGVVYLDEKGTIPFVSGNSTLHVSFNDAYKVRSDYKTINFGVEGGWGVAYDIGSGIILAECRNIMGINNIQKDQNRYGKKQTNSLSFGIGYTFKIK